MSALILRFQQPAEEYIATSGDLGRNVAYLDVPAEKKQFCSKCQSEQTFVFDRELINGWLGTCMGCGDEYRRPFSRTTSGVAS